MFFFSCSGVGSSEHTTIRSIDLESKPIVSLEPTLLDIDIPGILEVFYVHDKTLFRTRDPENLFYVWDNNSGEIISQFGKRGESPTDFLYPRNFSPSTDSSVWITDMGLKRIYNVEVADSTSLKFKQPITSYVSFREIEADAAYLVNESKVFGILETGTDSTVFFLNDLNSGNGIETFSHETYRLPKGYDDLTVQQQMEFIQKSTALKPDHSKMVVAHYFAPYISIVSSDGSLEHIISVKQLDLNRKVNHVDFEKNLYAIFEDVSVTDDFIYIITLNQLNEQVADVSKPIEILVFDWELNLIQRLGLDEYALSISVSPESKDLIGVDYTTENVFKYRLP